MNLGLTLGLWGFVTDDPNAGLPDPGDFDLDGDVDENDLGILQQSFDEVANESTISRMRTVMDGDANYDGIVDESDFGIWVANAPSNIRFVSTDSDVDDGNYAFGQLSLREALDIAVDGDRILFAPWVTEITLGGSQLIVPESVEVVGLGADKLTIDASNASRVFSIDAGATTTISGLTIARGAVNGAGAGIYNAGGNLTLSGVVVTDNHATGSSGLGGGLFSTGGSVTVTDSEFHGNTATRGGAIRTQTGTTLSVSGSAFYNNAASNVEGALSTHQTTATIENSTFSGNSATNGGGAIRTNSTGQMTIVNSTIAHNTTTGFGGGIQVTGTGTVTLHSTILAANTAGASASHDVNGALGAASSYNLIGQVGGSGLTNNVNGNKVGTATVLIDPLLAPLGDYGGKTKTHALRTGSPALDAGKGSLTDLYDQRGYQREYDLPGVSNGGDDYRDIGAYEAGEGTTLIVRSDGDRNDSVDLKATTDSLRLREALALSAALAGTEIISFDQVNWTDLEISLSPTWGQLVVAGDVFIDGPGADKLTIDAENNSRVFLVEAGRNATFSGLRITGGNATTGGGIFHGETADLGRIFIIGCQVDGNTAQTGGGLYLSGGELTILNSTFSGNTASDATGGGMVINSSPSTLIANSTISSNYSEGDGGGVYARISLVRLINSTVAHNVTAGNGGGIRELGGSVRLDNTIVASNTSPSGNDIYGGFDVNSSNNLIGFDSNVSNGINHALNGNKVGGEASSAAIDPGLMALDYYFGSTKTHALLLDSPAIDSGDNDFVELLDLLYDQRGRDRIIDRDGDLNLTVDIGAVESGMLEYEPV